MNKKKKRNLVSIFTVVIILILTFLIRKYEPTQNQKRDYSEIAKDSVMYIVTSYDPIGLYVSGDSVIGFNYELLQALQKYTDIKFKISIDNNLHNNLEGLRNHKYDLLARNMPITSHLSESFNYTQPIAQSKLVLIQRKEEFNDSITPIRNRIELAKKTIHVPKHSPAIMRLENLATEIGDTIFIQQDSLYDIPQLAIMVASGDIDFTVSDAQTAKELVSKLPELDIKTDLGFTHFEAWIVRSDSQILLDSLNTWLNKLKTTKEYLKIYNMYYMN